VERDVSGGDIASRGSIVLYRNGEGNGFSALDAGLVFRKTYIDQVPGTPIG
jgi:hypothetical protein